MPSHDYASVLRSVYGDPRTSLAGSVASAAAAWLTAYRTGSLALYLVTLAFVVIGLARYANMRAFWRATGQDENAAPAEVWETRALIHGGFLAATYGAWCLISMAVVKDSFAELASVSISIAIMVGVVARNFGLDRLVAIQMLLIIVPLSVGVALHGDVYHVILAALVGLILTSFRRLAANVRTILLSAVHGRVEASRLAAELDMAMATLEHGLCLLDEHGTISVVNDRAERLFAAIGVGPLVGLPLQGVLETMAQRGVPRTATGRLLNIVGQGQSGKVLLCLANARYFEVTVSTRQGRSVLLFEDISDRVATEERISYMARHDVLTGLPNRTYFGELTSEDLDQRRAERSDGGRVVSLMIIDVDDFKHVNDSFGHLVGDELLMQVARRLRKALPEDAVLARLGGDEFVAYRRNVDRFAAEADAQPLLEAFQAPFLLEGLNLQVNVSIGLVISANPIDLVDDLMTKADLALYSAKGDGKAKSHVFHAQMDIDYHYKQRLKADLRLAIQEGGLTLAFQPLLDVATRKVVACEALARWNHPELGMIAPSVFIPLAEETGLISDITAWVIAEAISQCRSWPGEVGVAVNVSTRDFRGMDVEKVVDAALSAAGLPPTRLEIEVTETALIEEPEIAKSVLEALAAKGVEIALDDFGTGYSSLSYLSALPFSKLKIDRSFVQDIEANERSLRLLTNVASLGRDLDLTVVAEGVETSGQFDLLLAKTQIQQVQGYLFSRPLPARDIPELIVHLNHDTVIPPKRYKM
ncbi:EAL domain-containing protein [Devosia oryziradicis]|uniref:EAL domain-containing protein n=1 Tax=Devosia oryziradicis TaxID=2801335 RepID=A0ABX7BYS2_9HYPH|nr:EAL domain-containing protein [Devosia oryziradicis]QQR36662.1 EAL domain-containing protein [Devosia oryziradicis]